MRTPEGVSGLENLLRQVWPAPHSIALSSRPSLTSAGHTFGLLPGPDRPTLLLPIGPRRVTAQAVRGYKSSTTRTDRLRGQALGWAARTGVGYLFPWTVTVSGPPGTSNLVSHIEEHLGVVLHVAIALGPPRANRKPVLQLMTGNGNPVAFVKVGINPLTSDRVLTEARALGQLKDLTTPGLSVPEIMDIPAWQNTNFLATEPLDTWTTGRGDPDVRGRALRGLAAATAPLSTQLRDTQWWQGLRRRLQALAAAPEASRLGTAREVIELRIGNMHIPQGSTHGDWSPWNIAVHGSHVSAWDWERFMPHAPIGYDSLHYAVQEEIRLRGKAPREALVNVLERASLIVVENGADPELGNALFALYLLSQGEQHLTDRQLDAGSERGPISEWLIPVLERATARLERSTR